MLKVTRFKIYTKSKTFLLNCPKKLLKFKKSKWVSYKNILKKNLAKRFFFNFSLTSTRLRFWDKKKLFFKQNLLNQRQFLQLYDNSLRFGQLKKEIKNKKLNSFQLLQFFRQSVLKFEFKLPVLLVRLKFFFNIFEARKWVDSGKVLVNCRLVSSNYILKQGDVIKIKTQCCFNKQVLNNFLFCPLFVSFVEIDYYLNQIIVVKNFDSLSELDASLLSPKHFNLSRMRHAYFKT